MSTRPPQLSPRELAAYFAFTEVSSLLRHAVVKQLRDVGKLSYVQFHLLARLGDAPDGSQRMTDLADGVVYSRSGLTYQALSLDEGRDVFAKVSPGHIDALQELLLDSLSARDVELLARVMAQVSRHLRKEPPRSATPQARSMND